MEYFFIAYLAMLVFLFTKLRRLQHSSSFQAAFGLLILVPLSSALETIGVLPGDDAPINWQSMISNIVFALSMFNLGRALFQQPDNK
jgi:hypothetical protein